MKFNISALEELKKEMVNRINPEDALLVEKSKTKSPALQKLVQDLVSKDAPKSNIGRELTEFAHKVDQYKSNGVKDEFEGYTPINPKDIKYNPLAEDISFNDYEEDEFDMRMNENLQKRRAEIQQYPQPPYQPQVAPQYQQQLTYQPQNYYQPPMNNQTISESLLNIFAKDFILKTIKEYMSDEDFKKAVVDIVRASFKTKK